MKKQCNTQVKCSVAEAHRLYSINFLLLYTRCILKIINAMLKTKLIYLKIRREESIIIFCFRCLLNLDMKKLWFVEKKQKNKRNFWVIRQEQFGLNPMDGFSALILVIMQTAFITFRFVKFRF